MDASSAISPADRSRSSTTPNDGASPDQHRLRAYGARPNKSPAPGKLGGNQFIDFDAKAFHSLWVGKAGGELL
jgi:hypothetical protein